MNRYLTTIALLGAGVVPIFIDVNPTPLLNPGWDSHARVHEAWRLSINFLIFLLVMYPLWVKGHELVPALLGLCILFGFETADITMPWYSVLAIGEGIHEPSPLGIPLNVLIFSVALII